MAVATAANVKSLLGIPAAVTQHDARIALICAGLDGRLLAACGVAAITNASYDETIDVEGPAEDTVRLTNRPIVSVAALTDDGSLVATTDYYLPKSGKAGVVRLTGAGAFFTEGKQMVSVTYTAGFGTSVPADFAHAADLWAVATFNASPHAGLRAERFGDYSFARADDGGDGAAVAMPPEVRQILARYRMGVVF